MTDAPRLLPAEDEFAPPECVVLGSGFSRAISKYMPTMPELGARVLEELHLDPEVLAPFGGNLEQWMSYLSIDQPWLAPAENYKNRGLFEDVSEAISDVIISSEMSAIVREPLPIWLIRLAWKWSDEETAIFSFNYDTLVERAVGATGRVMTLGDLYALPLAERWAVGDGGGMFATAPPPGPLPTLFKLHGSTSWGFGGLDGPPNDRVTIWDRSLRWAIPRLDEAEPPRRQRQYADLVPLIIPPTLTKGPFFTNLSLRAQWADAANLLRDADRLTVMGYSFPAADLVAQQWVGTNFEGDQMNIIDRDPERPGLIRSTLANPRDGEDITGPDAIQSYVDRECGDHVAWRLAGDGVSLEVNGTDLLEGVAVDQLPWSQGDHVAAQRWIHTKVDEAGGEGQVDRAQGAMSGDWENRHVVLSPGKHLDVKL